MVLVYQPWNNGIVEYSGKEEYAHHRYCLCAYNAWLDAANTAARAVELWTAAREERKGFKAVLKEAQLFTESARAIASVAREEKGYEPARDRDPKKEFLEYSKKFHL